MNQLDLLKLIHSEIHYEHGLISNRMSWYVTSQAFLMTAFMAGGGDGHSYQSWSKWFIPIIGILISALIWFAIVAALSAMKRLRKQEFELLQRKALANLPYRKMPKIIHFTGMTPAAVIPIIFMVAWIVAWILANHVAIN
jgi:hypothetical protein